MKNSMIEAFELKRKGYYKQAIEIYYKLLSSMGDNADVLSELADLYFLLGNNERAIHYITKALEIESNHTNSLRVLRSVYLSQKEFEKAEDIGNKIYKTTSSDNDLIELIEILYNQKKYEKIAELASDTSDSECLYKISCALYELKKYSDAENIINKILTDDENIEFSEKIMNLLGKIYYEQRDMEKAKEVFKKLEDTKLQTAEGLNFIGLNKLDELKLDEAIGFFNQAIEKDEKTAQYHYNMGQAYFLKGWIDEAEKCFNTAICLNPTEERYHYSLAYLYYKIGNYEAAKTHINTDYLDSKILLQAIRSETGDLASAKIELEKLLHDNPDNETILYSLSKIYYRLDMFKQSKTMIEQTIKINDKPFEYKSFLIRLMIKLGELDEAKENIKALIEKYPNYYYAKVLEAELNLANKDYDELFESAQDLIELDYNHYEGYYYNALALFEKEDINFAIESLKKAISLDVFNADLYVKMSEFYQAIGKYEDAFAYVKEASDIDKSAKNQELYMQLASILRKKGISG